jgi:hypothetical protein
VVHHGAGLSVPRTASLTQMADTVRTVLGDRSFADGAARLSAALRGDAASGLLLAELETGLNHRAFGAHPHG